MKIVHVSSIKELEELSGVRGITDLHRENIDHITIPSRKGKGSLKRIEEIFDCWFESGRSVGYDRVDITSSYLIIACPMRNYTIHLKISKSSRIPMSQSLIFLKMLLPLDDIDECYVRTRRQ